MVESSIRELMNKEMRYQWHPITTGSLQTSLTDTYSYTAHKKWREHVCEWMFKVRTNIPVGTRPLREWGN